MLPAEIIRVQRDGGPLSVAQVEAFARGLADGSWSDAQAGAMAMAILLRGMATEAVVALTSAFVHTGQRLQWPDASGPVLDKHSTGGVGDKLSLMLAPTIAQPASRSACRSRASGGVTW